MDKGALLSPDDKRDYLICRAMDVSGELMPVSFAAWQPPVENQGRTGNCVAQALANIFECIEYQQTHTHDDYSVGWIYGNRVEGDLQGSGMIPRQALAGLVRDGDVMRGLWECLEEVPECKRLRDAVYDSLRLRADKLVQSYIRLYDKDEVQRFIYRYKLPVLGVVPMSAIDMFRSDGYHAISVYGWTESAYKDMLYTNSWGTGGAFGDGRGKIAFDSFKEIWGCVPMAEKTFPDVPDARWSATAIKEAAADGIIEGFEDGTFRPTDGLTREQLAVIWQRMKAYVRANF